MSGEKPLSFGVAVSCLCGYVFPFPVGQISDVGQTKNPIGYPMGSVSCILAGSLVESSAGLPMLYPSVLLRAGSTFQALARFAFIQLFGTVTYAARLCQMGKISPHTCDRSSANRTRSIRAVCSRMKRLPSARSIKSSNGETASFSKCRCSSK